jgi:hypothetical protein
MKKILLFLLLLSNATFLVAQCDNAILYPAATTTLITGTNIITSAQYAGEYNVTTGYIVGTSCSFISSNATDFITLRKVADNAVIAQGVTPINIIYAAAMGNIEMHVNTNAVCGTANVNRTSTITMNLVDNNAFKGGNDDGFTTTILNKISTTDNNAFKGGNDDGFSTIILNKISTIDNIAFKGGNDDGFSTIILNKINTTDNNAFKGGNDDGFAMQKMIITDATAFKGGNDDGFATIQLAKININDNSAFKGGSDDGFATILLNKNTITDPIAFTGGIGRGETQLRLAPTSCNVNTIRMWNGSVSTAWENPNNWDCGILPTITSEVIIPNAVPHYPIVNFNFEIKKLILNPNASIIIMPAVNFKLNGL